MRLGPEEFSSQRGRALCRMRVAGLSPRGAGDAIVAHERRADAAVSDDDSPLQDLGAIAYTGKGGMQ